MKFKSASAPFGQSAQRCVYTPPSSPSPPPPCVPRMRSNRLGPPFCAEPTLQKRERIKTSEGEARSCTAPRTKGRADRGPRVGFNERINEQKQVK